MGVKKCSSAQMGYQQTQCTVCVWCCVAVVALPRGCGKDGVVQPGGWTGTTNRFEVTDGAHNPYHSPVLTEDQCLLLFRCFVVGAVKTALQKPTDVVSCSHALLDTNST